MILYRKFKDRIERNNFAGTCGWIIGGAKGYVGPPSQIIGGPGPPCPPPLFLRLWTSTVFLYVEYTPVKEIKQPKQTGFERAQENGQKKQH